MARRATARTRRGAGPTRRRWPGRATGPAGRRGRHGRGTPRPYTPPAGADPALGIAELPEARLTFTTRAALLALTLCVVLLALAYPARQYLAQRAEIGDLAAEQRSDRAAIEELRRILEQYEDPAYVEAEARRRLLYQRPGDVVLHVPPAPAPAAREADGVRTPTLPGREVQPWYEQLWRSAGEAGPDDAATG